MASGKTTPRTKRRGAREHLVRVAAVRPRPLTLKEIRGKLGVAQTTMSRILGTSVRTISTLENTRAKPSPETCKRLTELDRLRTALAEVMQADHIPEWIQTPNEGFNGLKPIEVIERGEIDRIWEMIFFLRSGVLS